MRFQWDKGCESSLQAVKSVRIWGTDILKLTVNKVNPGKTDPGRKKIICTSNSGFACPFEEHMTLGMHQLQAASGQGQAVLSAQACISKLDRITTSPHQPCFPPAPHTYGVLAYADVLWAQKLQLFVNEHIQIMRGFWKDTPCPTAPGPCSKLSLEAGCPQYTDRA